MRSWMMLLSTSSGLTALVLVASFGSLGPRPRARSVERQMIMKEGRSMAQIQTATASTPRRLAESYLMLISNMASAAGGGGVARLLGLRPFPRAFPVLGFA